MVVHLTTLKRRGRSVLTETLTELTTVQELLRTPTRPSTEGRLLEGREPSSMTKSSARASSLVNSRVMAVRPTSWLITTRRISPALTQRRTSRLLHSPELVARGRAISFTKCLILRLPSILRTFLTQAWFTKTSLCLLSKRLPKFLRVITERTSYASHSGFLAVIVLNEERFTFNQKYKAKFGETCGLFCKYKS